LPEDIYEAISHPTRRAVVKALGKGEIVLKLSSSDSHVKAKFSRG
jgi:hypothetical protein